MNLYQMKKRPLMVTLYDIKSFFDKEEISDVMTELGKLGVKNKEYRLLGKLNEKRVIKVATPVGDTDEEEVEEGISQGSLEGAVVSGASLGEGVNEYFKESKNEIFYGRIRLQPIL